MHVCLFKSYERLRHEARTLADDKFESELEVKKDSLDVEIALHRWSLAPCVAAGTKRKANIVRITEEKSGTDAVHDTARGVT